MRDIQGNLARVRKELSTVGIDTTGEGATIPLGFFRIHDERAEQYEEAGHRVERRNVVVLGKPTMVTLVAIGDPRYVAKTLRKRQKPHGGGGGDGRD